MEFTTFLITVYCLVDDWLPTWVATLPNKRLRERGYAPALSDSEVLTMEIVGEFLGLDTDKGLYLFFRRHWADWFPALRQVHRTTFTRQAANLWYVKQCLWKHLLSRVEADPLFLVLDSFPMPVCRFARAKRCRRLREHSAYGYDHVAQHVFYGLRVHALIRLPGVIADFRLAPANVSDVQGAYDLLHDQEGWALGDRNYWSPGLQEACQEHGLRLLAPFKSAKREKTPFPSWLKEKRRCIETVFDQLVERFQAKKVWAKDAWHLWSRWLRKVLSHTVMVWLCQQQGLKPLRFAELIID